MYLATVTKYGQVTIPPEIRKYLNMYPKDKVVFRIENDRIVMKKYEDIRLEDIPNMIGYTGKSFTDEELKEARTEAFTHSWEA